MRLSYFSAFSRHILLLVTMVFLASCGGRNDDFIRVFSSTLITSEITPPNQNLIVGSGLVTVNVDTKTLTASLVIPDKNIAASQIREGVFDAARPVIFSLMKEEASSQVWTVQAQLNDEQWRALRGGRYFFSASSETGDIHGQIVEQLPSGEQLSILQRASPQSVRLREQLEQIDEIDEFGPRRSGFGVGLTIGF